MIRFAGWQRWGWDKLEVFWLFGRHDPPKREAFELMDDGLKVFAQNSTAGEVLMSSHTGGTTGFY